MIQKVSLCLAVCLAMAGCSPNPSNPNPSGEPPVQNGGDSNLTGTVPDLSKEPPATKAGEEGKEAPEAKIPAGGKKYSASPSDTWSATHPEDFILIPPAIDSEAVHQKACLNKFDQCIATSKTDEDQVEKQRACKKNLEACQAEKTAEEKCEEAWTSCNEAISPAAYSIEAQRSCQKQRELCIATTVYPGCCENAYDTCMGAASEKTYSIEHQRGCADTLELCKARYYCK